MGYGASMARPGAGTLAVLLLVTSSLAGWTGGALAAEPSDETPVQPLSPGSSGSGGEGAVPETGSALSADVLSLEQSDDEELEDLSFSREGAYLGVGGTFAMENFDGIPGNQDDSATVIFRAGYRGYSWLSVDLLGEVLVPFEDDSVQDNDVDGYAVTVNARVIAPLGRVEPWVMFGIGFLDIDEDRRNRQDDFAVRPAAGFDLYITPHWAIYGEAAYMIGTGDVSDYDFATFGGGIQYRF